MTAYRYVRTGRLPAVKDGATWRVRSDDLDTLLVDRQPAGGTAPRRTGQRRTLAPDRLIRRLVAGDEAGAWRVIEDARAAGAEVDEVYVDLLIPALVEIGNRWSTGALTVGDEHTASAAVLRLVGRLGPSFNRRGRKRGTVVLGTVPGDTHGLPTALLADLLRGRGFEVHDLGANVPLDAWEQAVSGADRLVAVGVNASSPDQDDVIANTIETIRREATAPILVGGTAVRDEVHARDLGADGWAVDTPAVLDLFDAASG